MSANQQQLVPTRLSEIETAKNKITDPEMRQEFEAFMRVSNESLNELYQKVRDLTFPNDNEVVKSLRNQVIDRLRQVGGG